MSLRNLAYTAGWKRVQEVSIPVICIGNLTVGGTGKSPAVAWFCRLLRQRGIRVAIVSRGYQSGEDSRNDEARELELRLPDVPHIQNPNRYLASLLAQEELDSQCIVMDDGFQHRRFHRDMDVVLIDATEPFGYGYCLPRGLLRENRSGLRRSDVVLITRSDLVDTQRLNRLRSVIQRVAPNSLIAESTHKAISLRNASGATQPLESIRGKNLIAFCGVGNPDAFFQSLEQLGGNITERIVFPDHHRYDSEDIQKIVSSIQRTAEGSKNDPVDWFVCTGKDLAKIELDQLAGKPLWMVEIEMEVTVNRDALIAATMQKLERKLKCDQQDMPHLEDA